MQTIITVVATRGRSLRDAVVKDKALPSYGLIVSQNRRRDRPNGWAKIHSDQAHGAANLQWLPHANLLICRVVNRGEAKPGRMAGKLAEYLLTRHAKRIVQIQISQRARRS